MSSPLCHGTTPVNMNTLDNGVLACAWSYVISLEAQDDGVPFLESLLVLTRFVCRGPNLGTLGKRPTYFPRICTSTFNSPSWLSFVSRKRYILSALNRPCAVPQHHKSAGNRLLFSGSPNGPLTPRE